MNRKAEMGQVGMILSVGIGLIAVLALMPAIFGNIGSSTNTAFIYNDTVTTSGTVNVSVGMTGADLIEVLAVTNQSAATVDYTGFTTGTQANFTIDECIDPSTSQKSICLTGKNAGWTGQAVNVSYEYGPDGYIDNAGGRSMAGIIAIFAALAVAVFAMVPAIRNPILAGMKS